jgi:uncharacterized membrane protein YccC
MTSAGAAGKPTRRLAGVFPGWAKTKSAAFDSVVLAVACLITYLLVTHLLSHLWFTSQDSDLLGGMWAVIATIFVMRGGYQQSVAAAASRIAATLASFVICLIYLVFLPFHPWALAVLIGVSALIAPLIGRPQDAITAAITTTVLLVVAAVTPQHAWQQPILRLADTIVGVAVGIGCVWVSRRVIQPRIAPVNQPDPAPARHGRTG